VEQLNLLGTVPTQVFHFSSLSMFSLGRKTISLAIWRAYQQNDQLAS